MRVFYDFEFLEDGHTIDLISVGMVAEDGRTYYAVSADLPAARVAAHPWLTANVWPHLPHTPDGQLDTGHPDVKPADRIARDVAAFLAHGLPPAGTAELWGYYAAYDHVRLGQLWGTMLDRPAHVPMWTHELMQLWETAGRPAMPPKPVDAHHALADAHWNRALWQTCHDALTR